MRRGAELCCPDRLSDTRHRQASLRQLGNDIFSVHLRQMFRSPEHDEADSIDNTAHTPMSVDSEEEWDCSSIIFSCPIDAVGMGDPLHNCQNIQSYHLSQKELSNAARGECGEPY